LIYQIYPSHLRGLTPFKGQDAIKIIHYAFPAVCFLYFVLALTITVCTLQTQSLRVKDQKVRRDVMIGLLLVVTATYVRTPSAAFRTPGRIAIQPSVGGSSSMLTKSTQIAQAVTVLIERVVMGRFFNAGQETAPGQQHLMVRSFPPPYSAFSQPASTNPLKS
jgi:hypothetical protein